MDMRFPVSLGVNRLQGVGSFFHKFRSCAIGFGAALAVAGAGGVALGATGSSDSYPSAPLAPPAYRDVPAGPSAPMPVMEPHIQLQDYRAASLCAYNLRCRGEYTFGGQLDDKIFDIAVLDAGGVAVAGVTRSHGKLDEDGLVARLDSQGQLVWFRTLGDSGTDRLYGVVETQAGIMVAGHRQNSRPDANGDKSDVWLALLDRERGFVIWEKSFGGSGVDRANDLVKRPDGGVVVVGFTTSQGQGERDAWVLSVDKSGVLEWQRTFGGARDEEAYDVAVSPAGEVFLAGYTNSTVHRNYSVWVAALSPDGQTDWDVSYDIGRYSVGTSLTVLADGGLAVVGLMQDRAGVQENAMMLRLDSHGRALWHRSVGGLKRDSAWGVLAHPDGGFSALVAVQSVGMGSSDARVYRFDRFGILTGEYGYGYASWDKPTSIAQDKDGTILIGGYTTSVGRGYEDAWLVRLKKPVDGGIIPAAYYDVGDD